MADQEKKKGVDEIRVLEDIPDEVVRLDAPKVAPREKMGKMATRDVAVNYKDERDEEKEVRPFDPEGEWLDELAEQESKTVPMGWFVLLGVGLLGLVGWAGFQNFFSSSDEKDEVQKMSQEWVEGDEPLGKIAEIEAQQAAEKHFNETEKVIRSFLEAKTVAERLKYVRHAERVKPLMVDFYSRNALVPILYKQIKEYRIFPLGNLPFLALKVEDQNKKDHAILLEDGLEGLLVDWESFVCFQPVSLEDYARDRPTDSFSLRAYVSRDYFHSYEFANKEEFSSYRMRFRNSEVALNGYVKRGSELDQKFRKLFPNEAAHVQKPLILKVRFLKEGKALRSVLIEDLESTVWAFPRNPADVASGD
ncbi:MAG: hypothetical protein ACI9NQ_000092 [Paracoccaceae bacterium]|jgi:hypothetical protein